MDDDERATRIAVTLAAEAADPPRWWWLSFADGERLSGEQFLGACLVRAPGIAHAVATAHERGINPGGEVAAWELPEDFEPPADFTYRLLDREEAERGPSVGAD